MVIANPIYDVVFKRLMENDRVAKFFIGTMLGQKIESLELKPKEFTHSTESELVAISIFRLDFIAVIKTEQGEYKKVLIEIQKAKDKIDLMRFRNYLAEQYKKQETVNDEKVALPITTIYILGFKLPEIKTACIHVERQYKDQINQKILTVKSNFVEQLSHDSYVVQVLRITGKYQSKLDKLLSVFEQKNFIDDKEIIKEYLHQTDNEDIKTMTDILHHSGVDPVSRKEIENEQEAWRTINGLFETKQKAFNKAMKEKDQALEKKDQALEKKDQALEEKEQTIAELQKTIEELKNNQKRE